MKLTKGIRIIIGLLLIVMVLSIVFYRGAYSLGGDAMTNVSLWASSLAASPAVFIWHVIIFVLMAVAVKRKLNKIERQGVSREVLRALQAVVVVAFLSICIMDMVFFIG